MVEHNAIIQCLEKQDEENKKTRLILDETYEKKSEEYTIYNNFATLLNRDNLQATLIDEYIPVIEEEANNILHKLSDGRCSLSMESTRDLKSGKSKETLDIIVVDNAGSRPYEFFSGGEAFRIDLAIRIGLSKVLARQAGVTLKTLIIDEGFGSQDGTSLETVMHSIYSLQSDFDLIIIVSHLSSMKEQFPVHLVVTKTSSGSIIKTIGK
jgi:exonuclease SbcC